MSRFASSHVFRSHRFSLGRDMVAGGHYISLPVSGINRAAEYEAYFSITDDEFRLFSTDPDAALELVSSLITSPDDPRRIRAF